MVDAEVGGGLLFVLRELGLQEKVCAVAVVFWLFLPGCQPYL